MSSLGFREPQPTRRAVLHAGALGRLRYEPIRDKNHQGGDQRMPHPRTFDPESQLDARFIALFKEVVSKRPDPCKDDRILLAPNPSWEKSGKWFNNSPIGINKSRKKSLPLNREKSIFSRGSLSLKHGKHEVQRDLSSKKIQRKGLFMQHLIWSSLGHRFGTLS